MSRLQRDLSIAHFALARYQFGLKICQPAVATGIFVPISLKMARRNATIDPEVTI